MIAYLDTQVFDHLYRKIGCSGADIANLRKAIYGRDLSIRLSIHTLEEILLSRRASPQAFAAQIKLTLSIANSRALIKPCDQLVLDDLRSYAARGEIDRPFLRGEMQNAVAEGIAALIESDGEELDEDFVGVLEQAAAQKRRFAAMFDYSRDTTSADEPSNQAPNCKQDSAERLVEAAQHLAERSGVREQCIQRGWDGLLAIKSLRIALGATLAIKAGQVPQHAYSLAIHHAVSAAAVAAVFVCDDAALRELLSHVPVDDFEVIGLPAFLHRLAS